MQDNGQAIISLFNEVFRWLPVACLVDGKVLVVHGGISPSTDIKHLNTIRRSKVCSLNEDHFVFDVIQLRCYHFSVVYCVKL